MPSSASIVTLLMQVNSSVAPEHRLRVTEDVLRVFWSHYEGWLLHPDMATYIVDRVDLDDAGTQALFEDVLTRFRGALTGRSIERAQTEARCSIHQMDIGGALGEALDLFVSYLAIQQAAAVDVRRAARLRGLVEVEPLGSVLVRLEEAGALVSARVARRLILGVSPASARD